MPSFKPHQLWEAEPHTLAKIEIVRQYLIRWFRILGHGYLGQRLVYIDGFAGPGEYTNHPKGSPTAALEAARQAIFEPNSGLKSKECCFLFIDKEKWVAEHLEALLKKTTWPPQIKWEVTHGSFEEKIVQTLTSIKSSGTALAPTFAFIDPFGATGLPFTIIREILSYRSCEVLLNLDSDGIGRIFQARDFAKNKSHLHTLFGDNSWESELDPNLPMPRLASQILTLYKKKLRSIPGVRYVFAFAMNDKPGHLNYHLVFASQHPLGLEKMKEAMESVDQTGAYSFSDDTAEQELLPFDFKDPVPWAQRMHKALGGKHRPYSEFHDYALNETPFKNPKQMLEFLKKQDKVEVKPKGEPIKRGFPEAKIQSIMLKL